MTKTTISIDTATRDRLAKVGHKRESYDTIINRLIDRRGHNESEGI